MQTTPARATDLPMPTAADGVRIGAAQRRALLAELERLTPEHWRARTVCPLWDVHAMVAHVVAAAENQGNLRKQFAGMLFGRLRHRGLDRLDAMNEWGIDRRRNRAPERLLADFRRLIPGAVEPAWLRGVRLPDPDLHARMEADHEGIHGPLERLREVGGRLAAGAASRHEALAAMDALVAATHDQLAAEETEAMPAAGAHMTEAEWFQLSYQAWAAAVPPPQQAANGLWIIDGQDRADVRFFLKVVPLPYGDTSHWVAASPDEAYALVSDPTRVGEWSHEAVGARWVEGASHAEPGARFVGSSSLGRLRWSVPCVIDVADGRTFAFHTTARGGSTQWRYDLTPADGGTLVRQRFRMLTLWRPREVLLRLLVPSHADRSDALRGDLVRLGEVATGT